MLAASRIRSDQALEESMGQIDQREYETWLAVANLLDFAAPFGDQPQPYSPTVEHAMAIARAYLGDDA